MMLVLFFEIFDRKEKTRRIRIHIFFVNSELPLSLRKGSYNNNRDQDNGGV